MARGKELTGERFGRLTVIEKTEERQAGYAVWRCRCDCGNEKTVTAKELKAGRVKSCGCLAHSRKTNMVDLTGRRFGRLTVMNPTQKRDKRGSVFWHCRCDCGNELDATEAGLVHGNYQSCGCLKAENQKNIGSRLYRIDGTCVEILEKRKHRKDNKSGFRGVCRLKNGKYRVDIGFQGWRFYIGCFDTYEEAVKTRLEAEHLMHDGFIEAYYEWKKKADADPEWGKGHPFRFQKNWNGNREELQEAVSKK